MSASLSLPGLTAAFNGRLVVFATANETLRIEPHHTPIVYHDVGTVRHVPPNEWTLREVGARPYKRDVFHFLKRDEAHPERILRAGITYHVDEGSWSSLPHKFEEQPERGFEEIFFYLLSGTKKAIQVKRGLLHTGMAVDHVKPAVDRTFEEIPMGYHPVVGEPGCLVSYFWAYLAKKPEWEKL